MNFSSIGQGAAALAAMLCSCAMAAAAPPAVSATSAAPAAMAALAKARAGVHNSPAPVAVPTTADRHSANGVVAEGAAAASANEAANDAVNDAVNDAAGDAELEGTRGGAGVTTVDTRIAGQVSGNSANNVQSGWNIIDGGAFANITGIPIVIQNSGANVLIQNATVIQLQLQ